MKSHLYYQHNFTSNWYFKSRFYRNHWNIIRQVRASQCKPGCFLVCKDTIKRLDENYSSSVYFQIESSHAAPRAWQNLHLIRQSWIWEREIHKCNLYSHTHAKHFPKDTRITSIPRNTLLHSLLLEDINKLVWQIFRGERRKTKLVLLKMPYYPEMFWLSKAQTNAERKHPHKKVS